MTDSSPDNSAPLKPTLLRSPAQFLAFGFGSGLSPWAPGTAGTLVAVPLYFLMADLPLLWYSAVVLLSAVFGVWICDVASKQLNVHDHPGIVWDEFVGYWITLWAVPFSWQWVIVGFVVFRIFDVLKPWPISWMDRKVKGGFGIMIDDIVAGILACATLHAAMLWV